MKKKSKKPTLVIKSDIDPWQAECDARTLANAEEIKADKRRMKRSAKAAVKEAKEAHQKADALNKIAKKK